MWKVGNMWRDFQHSKGTPCRGKRLVNHTSEFIWFESCVSRISIVSPDHEAESIRGSPEIPVPLLSLCISGSILFVPPNFATMVSYTTYVVVA